VLNRFENAIMGLKTASNGLDSLIAEKNAASGDWLSTQVLKELKAMKRVCIANSIGIQAFLNRIKEGGEEKKVELDRIDFKYHSGYPVVILK
jgi:hypothetical protein